MENIIMFDSIRAIANNEEPTVAVSLAEGIEILVKKRLSLSERKKVVEGIADMCFVKESNGEVIYCPYLKRFAFYYHIVIFFTNIDLKDDVESVNDFLESSKIVSKIAASIGSDYIDGICHDVNELIEFRKGQMLKKTKLDELIGSVLNFVNTVTEKLEENNGEDIMKYLEENVPQFKEEMAKAFQEQQEQDNTK